MATIIGYSLFGAAILVALLNFYLSFLRAPLCSWLKKDVKHISGFPLVGNLFLIAALGCVDHTSFTWALTLAILALDTGGIPWFILTMLWSGWRHGKSEDHT